MPAPTRRLVRAFFKLVDNQLVYLVRFSRCNSRNKFGLEEEILSVVSFSLEALVGLIERALGVEALMSVVVFIKSIDEWPDNKTIDAVIEVWKDRLAKIRGSRPCDTASLTDGREGFQLIPHLRAKRH